MSSCRSYAFDFCYDNLKAQTRPGGMTDYSYNSNGAGLLIICKIRFERYSRLISKIC
jgi:hypothetical protein